MSVSTRTVPDTLVTTYLHMTEQSQFRPAFLDDCTGLNVMRMDVPDVGFYRFLYSSVGEKWQWRDRLLLSDDRVEALLAAPGTSVDVLYARGVPAGYIELEKSDESTKIAYFGLRSDYIGQGLGKHLLSYGIAKAWHQGTKRVWLHTCNLDGPHALNNYIKRGFSIYNVYRQSMPERYLSFNP